MLRNFFNNPKEAELERRMVYRRTQKHIEQSMRDLQKQKNSYVIMGRAAARNGSPDKVKQAAQAIRRCHQLENRMQAALNAVDLLQDQETLAGASAVMADALRDISSSLQDTEFFKALAQNDIAAHEAAEAQDDIDVLTEALMDSQDRFTADSAIDDLQVAELEAELFAAVSESTQSEQTATESAEAEHVTSETEAKTPAFADPVDSDLKELERELNLV